jgi:CheY-like chemotaxis protein
MLQNSQLSSQLNALSQQQFTGKIEIRGRNGLTWRIYLCLGRLIWVDGGYHSNRAWQRHLHKFIPNVNLQGIEIKDSLQFECWNYHILTLLLQLNLAQKEQIGAFVESRIIEVFFDILQHETLGPLEYNIESLSAAALLEYGLKVSLTLINIEKIQHQAELQWQEWCNKNLQNWSPNLAPVLKNKEQLQKEVAPVIYQNLVRLIDGNSTLRDLSFKMNKDVVQLTYSLSHYINKGLLGLMAIRDLEKPSVAVRSSTNSSSTQQQSPANLDRPLIICIDDSPQILFLMEHMLKKAGYRYLMIQEGLRALSTLIANKPDLIFLDIHMPVVNGYEICNQVRRVSKLKDIPVVMLTGNDGLVDRMRAKVSGASGFLSKPIEEDKILQTIEKFLSNEHKKIEERNDPNNLDRVQTS